MLYLSQQYCNTLVHAACVHITNVQYTTVIVKNKMKYDPTCKDSSILKHFIQIYECYVKTWSFIFICATNIWLEKLFKLSTESI
jgi:hypothetical protein